MHQHVIILYPVVRGDVGNKKGENVDTKKGTPDKAIAKRSLPGTPECVPSRKGTQEYSECRNSFIAFFEIQNGVTIEFSYVPYSGGHCNLKWDTFSGEAYLN